MGEAGAGPGAGDRAGRACLAGGEGVFVCVGDWGGAGKGRGERRGRGEERDEGEEREGKEIGEKRGKREGKERLGVYFFGEGKKKGKRDRQI